VEACVAHKPEVRRSKLRSATYIFTLFWALTVSDLVLCVNKIKYFMAAELRSGTAHTYIFTLFWALTITVSDLVLCVNEIKYFMAAELRSGTAHTYPINPLSLFLSHTAYTNCSPSIPKLLTPRNYLHFNFILGTHSK
jgi:hypothetical protein